jgi:hypothetical protein
MPDEPSHELRDRRLSLYAYLEPLWHGRRVLEVGRPSAAELLRGLGAAEVVSADTDPPPGETFDVIVVPEGGAGLRRPGAVAALRRLLRAGGRLVIAAPNADRPGVTSGVGYYDLQGALAAQMPHVQMLGMTPFTGVGIVEFSGAVDALRIDSRLVKETEAPISYVAVAGPEPVHGLGYSLVQLPSRAAGAPAREEVTRVSEVRADEIEELRGRLRRAAEDRAALDSENARLRRALAEADESVMNLTRKTTEEMAAVAERLAAGLRAPTEIEARKTSSALAEARDEADRLRVRLAESEARSAAAEQRLEEVATRARDRQMSLDDALERQRLAESDLARARREVVRLEGEARSGLAQGRALDEKTRAIADRDDRILRLEGEKQDLVWRLAELEDKLRQAIARAVQGGAGRGEARVAVVEPAPAAPSPPPIAAQEGRERAGAIEEFHRAAAVHVTELTDLKASLAEQTALVSELEDALADAEARATSAGGETAALRQTAKTLEESDRSRRARLAELEGKLLRLEHERRAAQQVSSQSPSSDEQLQRLQALEQERDRLRLRVGELEAAQARAAKPNGHAPAGPVVARELESIEADLRREVQRLETLDRSLAEPWEGSAPPAKDSAGQSPAPSTLDRSLAEPWEGSAPPAKDSAGQSPAPSTRSFATAGAASPADPARLENTLENYRSRASRLRDDLEGIRRRLDSLSPSELSGFLEELREDLAELGG